MLMTEDTTITEPIPYLYVRAEEYEVLVNGELLEPGQCLSVHNPSIPIDIIGSSYLLHLD